MDNREFQEDEEGWLGFRRSEAQDDPSQLTQEELNKAFEENVIVDE